MFTKPAQVKIAIVGLGYVGLPLAVEFGAKYSVIGFDIKQPRVDEINAAPYSTLEVNNSNLAGVITHITS